MEKFNMVVNLTRVQEKKNTINIGVEANSAEEAHIAAKALLSDKNVIENFDTNFAAGNTIISNGAYTATLLGHEEVTTDVETFGNISGVEGSDFSVDWSSVTE